MLVRARRMQDWINPRYLGTLYVEKLRKEFHQNKPFPHLVLRDFCFREKMIGVLKALSKEPLYEKESDLFQFMQTGDLSITNDKVLQEFCQFLSSVDFITYLRCLTGLKISYDNYGKIVDFFGSVYQDTDYLLCHDDFLEGRKIAFNVYLSNFDAGEGGSLNLLSSKQGKPWKVVKKIIPRFNTFAFFAVSKTSFHEVEEVLVEKQRIALSGWWH